MNNLYQIYELVDVLVLVLNRNIYILHVHVLCPIYFDLNLDPNYPDEPYAAFIITELLF